MLDREIARTRDALVVASIESAEELDDNVAPVLRYLSYSSRHRLISAPSSGRKLMVVVKDFGNLNSACLLGSRILSYLVHFYPNFLGSVLMGYFDRSMHRYFLDHIQSLTGLCLV